MPHLDAPHKNLRTPNVGRLVHAYTHNSQHTMDGYSFINRSRWWSPLTYVSARPLCAFDDASGLDELELMNVVLILLLEKRFAIDPVTPEYEWVVPFQKRRAKTFQSSGPGILARMKLISWRVFVWVGVVIAFIAEDDCRFGLSNVYKAWTLCPASASLVLHDWFF